MGKEWTEQHIIELIKKRIKIFKESGEGGNDSPDNPDVFSEYNYPIMLQNGIDNGKIYFLKDNAMNGSWSGNVFFARPGAVASSYEKLPRYPDDFNFTNFNDNILPVGGRTSSAYRIANLAKLKTEIDGGIATPAGTKGLMGYTTEAHGSYQNGSTYVFVSFPETIRDFDTDFNNLLQKLNSNYGSSTGGYYFLASERVATNYIDAYLLLNTNKIVILRDVFNGFGVEQLSVDFHGITLNNAVRVYHVTGTQYISGLISDVKQFFTDNNLVFEYFKVMLTSINFETADVASATTYQVYEMT